MTVTATGKVSWEGHCYLTPPLVKSGTSACLTDHLMDSDEISFERSALKVVYEVTFLYLTKYEETNYFAVDAILRVYQVY